MKAIVKQIFYLNDSIFDDYRREIYKEIDIPFFLQKGMYIKASPFLNPLPIGKVVWDHDEEKIEIEMDTSYFGTATGLRGYISEGDIIVKKKKMDDKIKICKENGWKEEENE